MSDRRRGVVLVTVLWLIALLSSLAMAAAINFRGFAGVVLLDRDRVQAEALLTGGLEAAVHTIEILGDTPLDELETAITLSTGSVRTHLSDEGGRIDIGRAPVEVLAALFRSIGVPARDADSIAVAIVEWRNPVGTDRPNAAGEKPFTDIRQLVQVPGVTPEWVSAIAPLTTVHGSETVNPLTAPAEVIAALPGVDAAQVRTFVKMRRDFPADASRLVAMLGTAQRYFAVKTPSVVSVRLTARLNDGFTQTAHAVIAPTPEDRQPYRVLVWNPLPSHALR
jgi:general secretion pathway protein K